LSAPRAVIAPSQRVDRGEQAVHPRGQLRHRRFQRGDACLLGDDELRRQIEAGRLPTSPMAVATAPVSDSALRVPSPTSGTFRVRPLSPARSGLSSRRLGSGDRLGDKGIAGAN